MTSLRTLARCVLFWVAFAIDRIDDLFEGPAPRASARLTPSVDPLAPTLPPPRVPAKGAPVAPTLTVRAHRVCEVCGANSAGTWAWACGCGARIEMEMCAMCLVLRFTDERGIA